MVRSRWVSFPRVQATTHSVSIMVAVHGAIIDKAGESGWVTARDGEQWFVIRLPAIAEADDQLGREIGEPLWPEENSLAALERQQLVDEYEELMAQIGERTVSRLIEMCGEPRALLGEDHADLLLASALKHDSPLDTTIRTGDVASPGAMGRRESARAAP